MLAACVNMLNRRSAIGGDVAGAGEPCWPHRDGLAVAAAGHGGLQVVPSQLGDEAGIIGAAVMVLETILAPAAVDAALVGAGRPG